MNLWSALRGRWATRRVVSLTRVEVEYASAFEVGVTHADEGTLLDLAWWAKTETVFAEDGSVWSTNRVPGPGIDRVAVCPEAQLPDGVCTLVICYPVRLAPQLYYVRATAPGDVREVAAIR